MDTTHSVLKSARQFFAGTLLSRFSGLFRDMAMAFCFGGGPEVAAFMVAYRLANLFRRLFGEGNLQAGFVPHFETLRAKNGSYAFFFYRDCVLSLSLLLVVAILAMEGLLGLGSKVLGAEWGAIAHLAMWMVPGLLFVCLASLNSALLQCQKKYFAPAIAPILFNVIWVIAVFFAAQFSSQATSMQVLSVGVTLAFGAQWMMTLFRVYKESCEHLSKNDWLRFHLFSPEWKKLLKPLSLGLIGVGAMQVNSTLDALFAYYADHSGPAYLWYAIRVQQLPLGLFGVALSGALLPPLARALQEGAIPRYYELLSVSLRQAATLIFPCIFGFFAVGASGLNLLFGRGAFTSEDLRETLFCLWGYGIGLLPAVFILVLASGFYAKKNYQAPTWASFISVLAHLGLNMVLIFWLNWGAVSIAIATSLSAWLNFWLLGCAQKRVANPKQLGTGEEMVWSRSFAFHLGKLTLVGAVAAGLSVWVGQWIGDGTLAICSGKRYLFSRSSWVQLSQFGSMGTLYLGLFLSLSRWIGADSLMHLIFGRAQKCSPGPEAEG